MVMVPGAVGVQVRSQTETPVSPLRPVAEIPSDLPDLQTGQMFRARIQEILPENTYKALVAGRSLTLSLAEGATVGDTLELVVVDRTPRTVVAQRAQGGAETAGDAYQHTTLSRTGQLIASLLARDGESVVPAALNRGRALLPQAPVNSADLAQNLPPRLAQAVTSSGLFYEAHQVQWAQGQRPLASLLTEPQGQHSSVETLAVFGEAGTAQEAAVKSALTARRDTAAAPPPATLLQTLLGAETATANPSATESRVPANQAATTLVIPDDLRPLVQQQLEAAATQRLAWHGEIWPQQTMEWEIERDAPQGGKAADDATVWQTNLRLRLPRLGAIDARLQLNDQGVQLVLRTPNAGTATDLQSAVPSLQQAFDAAGLTLLGVQTKHDSG